ncbi:MAG: sugar transferase [Cloacibacillus sp.]|nr:sugar transferase [Cloacibacillus sp.]
MTRDKPFQRILKRIFDISGAAIGILVFSPILLWTAYKITREMGCPVFFNRMRAGKEGKPFKLYKFRTMTDAKDKNGELLPDAERLTPLGQKIRSSSIDELPQLINVLKGEMSLVGPRPLLLEYVPLYNKDQKRRLDVPQGIPRWAQIHGRNARTWEEKFKPDSWSLDNWSFLLDMKIILMTIQKVLKHEGISAEGEATMPLFKGSDGYAAR